MNPRNQRYKAVLSSHFIAIQYQAHDSDDLLTCLIKQVFVIADCSWCDFRSTHLRQVVDNVVSLPVEDVDVSPAIIMGDTFSESIILLLMISHLRVLVTWDLLEFQDAHKGHNIE